MSKVVLNRIIPFQRKAIKIKISFCIFSSIIVCNFFNPESGVEKIILGEIVCRFLR